MISRYGFTTIILLPGPIDVNMKWTGPKAYFMIFRQALASSSRVLHGTIRQSMDMVWMLRT